MGILRYVHQVCSKTHCTSMEGTHLFLSKLNVFYLHTQYSICLRKNSIGGFRGGVPRIYVPPGPISFSHFYHPQMKFGARQYFCTCLSFCSQGGVPGQVHPPPWAGTSPWAGTPSRQVHSKAGTPPGHVPPHQCMLGYGQQAGGTHFTGMHSCLYNFRGKFGQVIGRHRPVWQILDSPLNSEDTEKARNLC